MGFDEERPYEERLAGLLGALMALGAPDEAKALFERALDKEPNNRAAREELAKAKKAVKAQYDKDAAALAPAVRKPPGPGTKLHTLRDEQSSVVRSKKPEKHCFVAHASRTTKARAKHPGGARPSGPALPYPENTSHEH